MNGYLLDTDHITLTEHLHAKVSARILFTPPSKLFVSPVTIEEVMRGRLGVLSRALTPLQRTRAYSNLVSSFDALKTPSVSTYTESTEFRYVLLRKLFRRLNTADLRIAASALEAGLTLVTRNRGDFGQIPGLVLEDWSI